MASDKLSKPRQGAQRSDQRPRWVNLLLMLTLLPLISGVVLLATPILGFTLFDPLLLQVIFGAILLLGSFAASNFLQKKWILAVGWTALTLAVVLLWLFSAVWAQAVAVALGASGLAAIAYEFWQRTRENLAQQAEK